MKKIFLFAAFAFMVSFTACGPAAERRDEMVYRSKIFQDSIANMIKTSMAEADGSASVHAVVPAPGNTAAATSTPAK